MTDAIIRSNAISRSAALSMMDEHIDLARDEELHHAMCVVAAGLAELPTLDVAPVVRCVDCKHRYTFVCPMYHTETYIGDLDGFDDDYEVDRTDDDGFCHLGERWECEEDAAD